MSHMKTKRMSCHTSARFGLGGVLMVSALDVIASENGASLEGERLFANTASIPRLNVVLEVTASNALRLHFRSYVRAGVSEGSTVYRDVGVHVKGNYGTIQPLDRKPSLTLNFDKYTKQQKFHGMDKLHLNNSVSDPSFITELLCRELFRAAGLPSARVSHACVSINGRDLGLYVLVEGHDKTFLRRFFANPKGNLYDSEFLHDITDPLRRSSGTGPDDHADLKALAQAA